jgi:hypothetical protein
MTKAAQAFLLLFTCFILHASAQVDLRNTTPNAVLFHANYQVQFPAGDMANRFGINSMVGGGIDFKRKLWLIGVEGNFLFGNTIKEPDVLNHLRSKDGYFVNIEGGLNAIGIFERGWDVKFNVARIIPLGKPNKNSGIKLGLSAGYIQHKIQINVDKRLYPQLDDTYKKGYDRLALGFLMTEFVGYQYFDPRRYLNFYGGFEFWQGYTNAIRKYNFDTNAPDPKQHRIDLLFGIKVGWVIPVFNKEKATKYYYR